MLVLKSNDRGYANHGWLKTQHTFSFADYYNPEQMGFRSLRVINEDHIDGGKGFGAHPHRDMEIITYILEGALEHQDSMGNKAQILPGEVQRMSAGVGVVHSEYNALNDKEVHLMQIWIIPKSRGGVPGYAQKSFEKELNEKKLVLVVSQDGRDNSLSIKQDADMYISRLKPDEEIDFNLRKGRGLWVQIARGKVEINGSEISAGDGASFENSEDLKIKAIGQSEIILFDML